MDLLIIKVEIRECHTIELDLPVGVGRVAAVLLLVECYGAASFAIGCSREILGARELLVAQLEIKRECGLAKAVHELLLYLDVVDRLISLR